ncbi:MAG: sugar phosphorylase [Spirochaetaceae bacterium]|jgi:sucrose phosphorylase|nr:sugar phosphorylase [Spirochaetaceae bacterium]
MPPFTELLEFIYGPETAEGLALRILELCEKKKFLGAPGDRRAPPFDCTDAFLISYGNMLSPPDRSGEGGAPKDNTHPPGLAILKNFLEKWNHGAFSFLHILPFHPYSSDDGFSVIDYRQVDARMGSWEDLGALKNLRIPQGRLKLAFDFVINHGSVHSDWFRWFLEGKERYRAWYLSRPRDYDYSSVVRPRTHPLLTAFERKNPGGTPAAAEAAGTTGAAEKVYVWTTFSADQGDYNFSDPEVLFEFITILLEYAERGAGIIRLDAIAYLWKEDGDSCLHHPKTHAVVKLFREIIDYLNLPLLILTETNVPHRENVSYFGAALGRPALDSLPEAHMVYNFALPPLTLYAALMEDSSPLRDWAKTLPGPAPGRYFLNFLASHDGVGLSPARGLIPEDALAAMIEKAKDRGALVSYKSTPAGDLPYELNCSYASVSAPPSLGKLRARAFLAAHGVLFSLSGLPAVYFHSWIGSEAWTAGPALLGYNRAVNREKPPVNRVEEGLEDPASFRGRVYRGINRMLAFRQEEGAFNPDVPQYVLDPGKDGNSLFVLLRGPSKDGRRALCIMNLGGREAVWNFADGAAAAAAAVKEWTPPKEWTRLSLEPWETLWLTADKKGPVRRLSTAETRP